MMTKRQQINPGGWLAGVALLAMAGCQPSEPTRTMDYYRANAAERGVKVKACANDPGGIGASPNCVNALRAEELEGIGSFRNLKPLPLPSAASEKKDGQ